jgi:hypothetical protein
LRSICALSPGSTVWVRWTSGFPACSPSWTCRTSEERSRGSCPGA